MTSREFDSNGPDSVPPADRQSPPPARPPAGNPYSSPHTTIVEGKLQPPQKLVWRTRVILFLVGFCGAVLLYLGFYWWAVAARTHQAPARTVERRAPAWVAPSSADHDS